MFYDPRHEPHGLPHSPLTALVVPRPIGWISTVSVDGVVNLSPYSFFNFVSVYAPFVMFSGAPPKDAQLNAERTGEFVANIATYDLRHEMNATSTEYGSHVSEPGMAKLAMVPSKNVRVPRVERSPIALECRYSKTVRLEPSDGSSNPSSVVFGEVVGVYISDDVLVDGIVDIKRVRPLGRLGYMDYCVVDDIFSIDRPGAPEAALGRNPQKAR
jgi:flavin reductase (DIM6/NTAB) family NADH-FMN oxidoreductase RutF